MSRIQIRDLPENLKIGKEEMRMIQGGMSFQVYFPLLPYSSPYLRSTPIPGTINPREAVGAIPITVP